jgi:hypothetical protein
MRSSVKLILEAPWPHFGGFIMADDPSKAVELTGDEKERLVEKKATCPFIGSAVAQGVLAVRNSAENPLASIEDVRRLGNSGGGDLGDLLVVFASGNHALMLGASGALDKEVPSGLFSLEFPGSQGSHPGHSGILQGDPDLPGSGRLSPADFARLARRAKDGLLKRSDIGRFIAENLFNDARAKVFGNGVAKALVFDLLAVGESIGPAWMRRIFGSDEDASAAHRDFEEKLTKLLGEDNLVGAAGEFGLLFAFLANKPGAREIDGDPAVAVQDLEAMFVDKRLPEGWENWKKSRIDWVKNTAELLVSAGREYLALKRQ